MCTSSLRRFACQAGPAPYGAPMGVRAGRRASIGVVAAALGAAAAPVSAQFIWTVTTPADTQDGVPGDGSPIDVNGDVSLRSAVTEATWLARQPGPPLTVEIRLPDFSAPGPTTYALTIPNVPAMVEENDAFTGDLDVGSLAMRPLSLTIVRLPGAVGEIRIQPQVHPATLQPIDRILHVFPGASLGLRDVTLLGGRPDVAPVGDGGGIAGDGATVVLESVIVRSCSATRDGGGIFLKGGALRLEASTIEQNSAAGRGGGVCLLTVSPFDCNFTTVAGNSAQGDGGGLFLNLDTPAQILQSAIIANFSNDGFGGGLCSESAAPPHIMRRVTGTVFMENGAVDGGGAWLADHFLIDDCAFMGNNAFGRPGAIPPKPAVGAGIYAFAPVASSILGSRFEFNTADSLLGDDFGAGLAQFLGVLVVDRCTFRFNNAVGVPGRGMGGGIGFQAGDLLVRNTRILENTAGRAGGGTASILTGMRLSECVVAMNISLGSGGGIAHNQGSLELTNTTVSGNVAESGDGGGVLNRAFLTPQIFSAIEVSHCTIAHNRAPLGSGGGIWSVDSGSGSVGLVSTILADNVALDLLNPPLLILENLAFTAGGITPVQDAGSNVDTDGTAGLSHPVRHSGTQASPLPAGLGGLQNNGGFTETHALLPGSPALGLGAEFALNGQSIAHDQRFSMRSAPRDSGAYEEPGVGASPCPVLLDQPPAAPLLGIYSDAVCTPCGGTAQVLAESFILHEPQSIGSIVLWGGFLPAGGSNPLERLTINIHEEVNGLPGTLVHSDCNTLAIGVPTGQVLNGAPVMEYTIWLCQDVTLAPGRYCVEIYQASSPPAAPARTFFILQGVMDPVHGLPGIAGDLSTAPGANWNYAPQLELAMQIRCGPGMDPCCRGAALAQAGSQIGFGSLLALLGEWGQSCSAANLSCSGTVGQSALLVLLSYWGPCPQPCP